MKNQLSSLNLSSALSDKLSSGHSAKTPLTPNKTKLGNQINGSAYANSLNEDGINSFLEGVDSQQGTLESTDGHYTAASAFASKGKFQPHKSAIF